VLHANTTLADRVDLATPALPLNRLPASRLLLPRSGLERSDFVHWGLSRNYLLNRSIAGFGPISDVSGRLLKGRASASFFSPSVGRSPTIVTVFPEAEIAP
jgi:hypothetical protein